MNRSIRGTISGIGGALNSSINSKNGSFGLKPKTGVPQTTRGSVAPVTQGMSRLQLQPKNASNEKQMRPPTGVSRLSESATVK